MKLTLYVAAFSCLSVATALSDEVYVRTSLEQAFTAAYNAGVEDGDWNRIFGSLEGIRAGSYCTGSPEQWTPHLRQGDSTSDLERVIRSGVFRCGFPPNFYFATADGTVLIQSGNTTNSVSGAVAEWFDTLAAYVSELVSTPVAIEWQLMNTSQDLFTALYNGEVDAACGYMAPDGTWTDLAGDTRARAYSFSAMYCPTFLQTDHLYTRNDSSIGDFDALIAAIEASTEVSLICVTGTPGGGITSTCQNLFDQYAAGDVECRGMNEASFAMTLAGECLATYAGFPVENEELLSSFPIPVLYAPVTFFRQDDYSQPAASSTNSESTSMEVAVTHAWNQLVTDSTYADILGRLSDTSPVSMCSGGTSWPISKVEAGSDLEALLGQGVFRCGYPRDLIYATSQGEVILDTTDPANVTGAIPDFFERLIQQTGTLYDRELTLAWELFNSSQQALVALQSGEIEANCAYWNPDGSFRARDGALVARGLAFSTLQCPVFAQDDYIYTPADGSLTSLGLLIQAVDSGEVTKVCVSGSPGGGSVASCSNMFAEYATQPVECVGLSTEAFAGLETGDCDAVFSGFPPAGVAVHSFPRPTSYTPVTLFRNFDLSVAPEMVAPTSAAPVVPAPTISPLPSAQSPSPLDPVAAPESAPSASPTSSAGAALPGLAAALLAFVCAFQ